MKERDRICYSGPDDADLQIWHGHPGRVIDAHQLPHALTVTLVNGPSLDLPVGEVQLLSRDDYARRIRRVLSLHHPTEPARSIPAFWAVLEPWPEDSRDYKTSSPPASDGGDNASG